MGTHRHPGARVELILQPLPDKTVSRRAIWINAEHFITEDEHPAYFLPTDYHWQPLWCTSDKVLTGSEWCGNDTPSEDTAWQHKIVLAQQYRGRPKGDTLAQVITPEIRVMVHIKPLRGPQANEVLALHALWVNLDRMAALRDKQPVFLRCDDHFKARDPVPAMTVVALAQKAGLNVQDWRNWIKLAQDYMVHSELTLQTGAAIGQVLNPNEPSMSKTLETARKRPSQSASSHKAKKARTTPSISKSVRPTVAYDCHSNADISSSSHLQPAESSKQAVLQEHNLTLQDASEQPEAAMDTDAQELDSPNAQVVTPTETRQDPGPVTFNLPRHTTWCPSVSRFCKEAVLKGATSQWLDMNTSAHVQPVNAACKPQSSATSITTANDTPGDATVDKEQQQAVASVQIPIKQEEQQIEGLGSSSRDGLLGDGVEYVVRGSDVPVLQRTEGEQLGVNYTEQAALPCNEEAVSMENTGADGPALEEEGMRQAPEHTEQQQLVIYQPVLPVEQQQLVIYEPTPPIEQQQLVIYQHTPSSFDHVMLPIHQAQQSGIPVFLNFRNIQSASWSDAETFLILALWINLEEMVAGLEQKPRFKHCDDQYRPCSLPFQVHQHQAAAGWEMSIYLAQEYTSEAGHAFPAETSIEEVVAQHQEVPLYVEAPPAETAVELLHNQAHEQTAAGAAIHMINNSVQQDEGCGSPRSTPAGQSTEVDFIHIDSTKDVLVMKADDHFIPTEVNTAVSVTEDDFIPIETTQEVAVMETNGAISMVLACGEHVCTKPTSPVLRLKDINALPVSPRNANLAVIHQYIQGVQATGSTASPESPRSPSAESTRQLKSPLAESPRQLRLPKPASNPAVPSRSRLDTQPTRSPRHCTAAHKIQPTSMDVGSPCLTSSKSVSPRHAHLADAPQHSPARQIPPAAAINIVPTEPQSPPASGSTLSPRSELVTPRRSARQRPIESIPWYMIRK